MKGLRYAAGVACCLSSTPIGGGIRRQELELCEGCQAEYDRADSSIFGQ